MIKSMENKLRSSLDESILEKANISSEKLLRIFLFNLIPNQLSYIFTIRSTDDRLKVMEVY